MNESHQSPVLPVALYLVRHGTSEWNSIEKWQGQTDTDLAPEGVAQAIARGKSFAAEDICFDAAYSSDLRRASHTAELLMKHCSRVKCGAIPRPAPLLRECSLGEFEGMKKSEIYGSRYQLLWDDMKLLPHEARVRRSYFYGLEAPLQVGTRCAACMVDTAINEGKAPREIVAEADYGDGNKRSDNEEDEGVCGEEEEEEKEGGVYDGGSAKWKNVLMVTHSTVIESLLATHFGVDFDSIGMDNLCWLRFSVHFLRPQRNCKQRVGGDWHLELEAKDGLRYRHSLDAVVARAPTASLLCTAPGDLSVADLLRWGPPPLVHRISSRLLALLAAISTILTIGCATVRGIA